MSRFDRIVEIGKFNPFHDSLGRFSDKNGFKTYSANPKMRAAQPSIARSAQAGHGHTPNVHRESKGENINQNYDWMQGKPFNKPAQPAQPAQPTQPSQPAQPTRPVRPRKPATNPQTKPAGGSIKDGTAEHAVEGQDLAGKFQFQPSATGGYAIEQVIKAQGFDGKPTITKDAAEFADACRASNFIAKRGIGASNQQTLDQYYDDLKNGDFYVKCSGGSVHGYGMYAASVLANAKYAAQGIRDAQSTGDAYARQSGSSTKTFTFTLDKSAKITTENDLYQQMRNDREFLRVCQNSGMNSSYTRDVGVYAAYKGYDAYIASGGRTTPDGHYSDYTVVLNRSKMILFDAD